MTHGAQTRPIALLNGSLIVIAAWPSQGLDPDDRRFHPTASQYRPA